MQQLACCGYCGMDLCDAFEVDHINENRTDDRDDNLVAACALCHAIKTRHVRLGRDWSSMRGHLAQHRRVSRDRWRSGEASWDRLPPWMRARVTACDAHLYFLSMQPVVQLDLEQYRYTTKRPSSRRSG